MATPLARLLGIEEWKMLCQTLSLAIRSEIKQVEVATLNEIENLSTEPGNHLTMITSGIVSLSLAQYCHDGAPHNKARMASKTIHNVCTGIHNGALPRQFRSDLFTIVTARTITMDDVLSNIRESAVAVLAASTRKFRDPVTGFDLSCFLTAVSRNSPISKRTIDLVHQLSQSNEHHDSILRSGILSQIVTLDQSENPAVQETSQQVVANMMDNPAAALKLYDMHLMGRRAQENMDVTEMLLGTSQSPIFTVAPRTRTRASSKAKYCPADSEVLRYEAAKKIQSISRGNATRKSACRNASRNHKSIASTMSRGELSVTKEMFGTNKSVHILGLPSTPVVSLLETEAARKIQSISTRSAARQYKSTASTMSRDELSVTKQIFGTDKSVYILGLPSTPVVSRRWSAVETEAARKIQSISRGSAARQHASPTSTTSQLSMGELSVTREKFGTNKSVQILGLGAHKPTQTPWSPSEARRRSSKEISPVMRRSTRVVKGGERSIASD
jgi:hypothetical protein